ncbi:amino acid adenylation domain-containing protein [Streptomyces sp. NPDC057302]|uniref:non-ribosomal peptide synthetase family protein n=1 Tax=Streptomyces sp. NPDC057302 TaxID=3346094 RepID=UPI00363BFC7D
MNNPLITAILNLARRTLRSPGLGPDEPFLDHCDDPALLDELGAVLRSVFGVDPPSEGGMGGQSAAAVADRLTRSRSGSAGQDGQEVTAGSAPRNGGTAEASFGQSGIWLIDQYLPTPQAYNGPFLARLPFRLDGDRLRRAVAGVLRRQEILRTTYALRDARLLQVVSDDDTAFHYGIEHYGDDKELDALAQRVANARLDLEHGPVLSVTCALGPGGESAILCNIHHIASDAASAGVFLRELVDAYDRIGRGLPVESVPGRPQYADFAHWHRTHLTPERTTRLLDEWADRLAGELPVLALPADRPRPATQEHRGGTVPLHVPAAVTEKLERLAEREGVTLFMTLLAVYGTFLTKLTRQERVLVGSPVSLRDDPQTKDLVGYFVNMVVLRQDVAGSMTVREVLGRAREEVADALRLKWAPFDKVVERLRPDRGGGHTPVVQTMLVLTDPGSAQVAYDGAPLSIRRDMAHGAKYDLSVVFAREADGLHCGLEYDAHLFDEATARSMGERLGRLLSRFAEASPDTPVRELGLLAADEEREVLAHDDRVDRSAPPVPVTELFERRAAAAPDAVAVTDGGRRWTYRELDERAGRLARVLREEGAAAGRRVAIALPRSLDMVAGLLAVVKSGASYVPLDPSHPPQRVAYVLDDTEALLVLTDSATGAQLPPGTKLLETDRQEERIAAADPAPLGPARTPDDEIYVIHTSGSTGAPKGVVIKDRTVGNLVAAQDRVSPCGARGTTLQYMTLSFDVSVMEILGTLCVGGTLALIPDELQKDLHRLAAFVAEHDVTRLYLPYIALQRFAALAVAEDLRCDALREVTSVGEALVVSPQIREFFTRHPRARLLNMYGPSETHLATWHELSGEPADWPEAPPIGRAVDGMRLRVLGPDRELLPPGVTGELYIGGPHLSPGYRGRPEETARRFLPDPYGVEGELVYRTGDLVRWNSRGDLEYLGRADDQIKIRGYRVEPSEVEARLDALDGVRDSAVVAVEFGPGDRRLVAAVTGDGADDGTRLRAALAERLPEYLVPAHLVRLDRLPTTPSGKIDRAGLAGRLAQEVRDRRADEASGTAQPPRAGTERAIAEAWSDVLGSGSPGRDDDFFAVGGNSIIATELVYRLRTLFEVDIPLRALFDSPTVAGMAARIDERRAGGTQAFTEPAADLRADVTLPDAVRPGNREPVAPNTATRFLLTGATGFLGSWLLRELAAVPGHTVTCLVRADDAAAALARLHTTADRYGISGGIAWDRVRAVPGDLARDRMGLSDADHADLADSVEAVHHAAAHINFVLPYASVKPTNVDGLRSVLEFAAAGRLKHVHHMSTVAVFAPGREGGPITEEAVPDTCEGLGIGYTQSKWVAEGIARLAQERGMPMTVYRIGRISGDSVTGACQADDFLWRQIKSFIELGSAPPAEELTTDLLPVDFVGRAVHALSREPSTDGATYHLFHPRGSDFTPVHAAVRDCGHPLDTVPAEEWLTRLEESARRPGGNALAAAVPLFREGALELGDNTYANERTTRLLDRLGLHWPDIERRSLTRMIRWFEAAGELDRRPPGRQSA